MYGVPDDEFGGDLGVECEDENKYKVSQLLKKEKDTLKYEYDFGDSWEHKIVLEKIIPYDGSVKVPTCIKGKRACPPEDCGGIWGYQNFLEAIQDPSHLEHEEMLEWVGGEFDPELLNIEETNSALIEYHGHDT
jgi:hypothetical protein